MVILALLVSTVGVLNYFWLSQNTVPPHWDAANHMTSAMTYHGVLSQCFSQSHFALPGLRHCLDELVSVNQCVYPPLFPLAGGLVIFLAGSSITALAMTNLPFIALLVGTTYLMGRTIHSRLAGVLAAILIVAYPLVFQMSHEFMLEFAMLAIAAAASCFLLLSDRFSKTGMTVLFGLTTGLGALTKITLLTYLIGPAIWVFAHLLTDVVRRRVDAYEAARRLLTLAGALALGLAVAALWYWPNRAAFLSRLRTVASLDVIDAPVLSLESLAYYPNAMIWAQMGPPLFLLFIYGAFRFASHVTSEWRDLLLVWIGSIYVILTAFSHKGPHDSIGILVPAALISAIGIASLRRRRYAAVAVVSCFALLQVAVMTLPSTLGARVGTFGWVDVVSPFPLAEDWKVEDTLHSLANRPARVAVISDHIFINGTTLRFYALKDNLPLDVSPCWRSGVDSAALRRYDVVIAKSDDAWVHPSYDGCFKGPAGREDTPPYSVASTIDRRGSL